MTVFSGILVNPIPGTIKIVSADGTIDGQDDGLGNITGTGINAGTSSIIYNTGELEVETTSIISGTLSAYYNNSSSQWSSDTWTHLRIGYNGQSISVSKDGSLLGSVAAAGVLQPLQGSTANNLVALGSFHNPSNLFIGLAKLKLAEFRISSVDRGIATTVTSPLAVTLGSEQALASTASISNDVTAIILERSSISQNLAGRIATTGTRSHDVTAHILALEAQTETLDVEGVVAIEGTVPQDIAANIAAVRTLASKVVGTIARLGSSTTVSVQGLIVIPGDGVTNDVAAYIQVNSAASIRQTFAGYIATSSTVTQSVAGFVQVEVSTTDLNQNLDGNIAVTGSESLDVEANIATTAVVGQLLEGKIATEGSTYNNATGYVILASGSTSNDLTGVVSVSREVVTYCTGQIVAPSYGYELAQNVAGFILVSGNEQTQDVAANIASVASQTQDVAAYVEVAKELSQDVAAYVEVDSLQVSQDATAVVSISSAIDLDVASFLQISASTELDATGYVEIDGKTTLINVTCYISSGEISTYVDATGYVQTSVEESLDVTAYVAESASVSQDVTGEILRTATVVNLATGFLLSGIIRMSHDVEANVATTGDVVQNISGKIGASKTLLSNCTGRIVIGPTAFGSVASRSSGRDRT